MSTVARALLCGATVALLAACSPGAAEERATDLQAPGWTSLDVNAVSTLDAHAGVVALTSLRQDHGLETVVLDASSGRKLWAQPATMAGRPTGMGVGPPAVVTLAGDGGAVVVAVEAGPDGQGARGGSEGGAALVARDARTGRPRWTREVASTFGPSRCGRYVCLTEGDQFVVRDAADGHPVWHLNGQAEVQMTTPHTVELFRLGAHPTLEARYLRTGRPLWSVSVEQVLGPGVDTDGGWRFSKAGNALVGHVGPYQGGADDEPSPYGYFAVRLRDGKVLWTRKLLVPVDPAPRPGMLLLTRDVTAQGTYGGFERIDPRTGSTLARMPAAALPKVSSVIGLSTNLRTMGLYAAGTSGTAFELDSGKPTGADGKGVWILCTRQQRPLDITGHPGYYPVSALCPVDLGSGRGLTDAEVPPRWYTGSVSGWRFWQDAGGAVHGVKDSRGSEPGMYSP